MSEESSNYSIEDQIHHLHHKKVPLIHEDKKVVFDSADYYMKKDLDKKAHDSQKSQAAVSKFQKSDAASGREEDQKQPELEQDKKEEPEMQKECDVIECNVEIKPHPLIQKDEKVVFDSADYFMEAEKVKRAKQDAYLAEKIN